MMMNNLMKQSGEEESSSALSGASPLSSMGGGVGVGVGVGGGGGGGGGGRRRDELQSFEFENLQRLSEMNLLAAARVESSSKEKKMRGKIEKD